MKQDARGDERDDAAPGELGARGSLRLAARSGPRDSRHAAAGGPSSGPRKKGR